MKLAQYSYSNNGWNQKLDASLDSSNTLIIIFSSSDTKMVQEPLNTIEHSFPNSKIIGCSSAGEICKDTICTYRFIAQVIKFEKSHIKSVYQKVDATNSDKNAGKNLVDELYTPELKAIFVLSDGLNVNGSKLTEGISSKLPNNIPVTGGLAGDDDRFERTWVIVKNEAKKNYISAIGFYGDSLYYGYGSKGGWDKLGHTRKVTSSIDNVLYTIDSQPALSLYKRYLGDRAKELPNTGLLFPLSIVTKSESKVRTIVAIDEEKQSITFAGDIPKGSRVTLMKANFDRLINGAAEAAKSINFEESITRPLLSIAISCIGRKLVLGQRIEEELEMTLNNLPKDTQQVGYYSYGEISPLTSGKCDLHNQTMTLTLIGEY